MPVRHRIRHERDNLPAHHLKVLAEHTDRLRLQEIALQQRDGLLRAEEGRKLASLADLRSETLADVERTRARLESEMAILR